MLSFIQNIFGRKVTFKTNGSSNHVCVMDTAKRYPEKSVCLFSGHIDTIDFDKREVIVRLSIKGKATDDTVVIPFDVIVTVSRMDDNRLRMWIKKEED